MRKLAWHADVLAVGVSTGGPQALRALLGALPGSFPVPVLVALHMPAAFTAELAGRLSDACALAVAEGRDGEAIEPGRVYMAPGGRHLLVSGDGGVPRVIVGDGPPENSCRPSADALFRSVAAVYGRRALAVVLTGMGRDGLAGCRAVREAGGRVLAQDKATSVVWGMPGAVAEAGLADAVVPLGDLAAEVARRVGPPSTLGAA